MNILQNRIKNELFSMTFLMLDIGWMDLIELNERSQSCRSSKHHRATVVRYVCVYGPDTNRMSNRDRDQVWSNVYLF